MLLKRVLQSYFSLITIQSMKYVVDFTVSGDTHKHKWSCLCARALVAIVYGTWHRFTFVWTPSVSPSRVILIAAPAMDSLYLPNCFSRFIWRMLIFLRQPQSWIPLIVGRYSLHLRSTWHYSWPWLACFSLNYANSACHPSVCVWTSWLILKSCSFCL